MRNESVGPEGPPTRARRRVVLPAALTALVGGASAPMLLSQLAAPFA
ncbi:DUF6053 domain-containing protein [Lysobacter enzymogenes]